MAAELGLKSGVPVVIGGNDAVLAAYSVGVEEVGDTINVNGTCEITLVCLPKCLPSKNYNIRAHVVPDRWLTLYVMNAGGSALEWFRNLFCGDMGSGDFYGRFLPDAIDTWIDRESTVTYVPYLMGSRYSLDPLKAEFLGLTAETTREELFAAMVRGLCQYQREHIKEIGIEVPLRKVIHITGGALNPSIIRAKKRWMRNCEYVHEEDSSMRGAALLGLRWMEQAHV
jgi:sugar (pentulose or hexulose) kinase